MPIYEYECKQCEHRFDAIHSYKDEDGRDCESCGSSDTYKIIHAPGVTFKGQGFYINDSRMDAKEAIKKKFEGKRYQTPDQRGDTERYNNATTGFGGTKKHKKD